MRGVITIWKKETWGYLTSARWYVVVAMIMSFLSLGFYLMNLSEGRQATLAPIAGWISFVLIFVTPIFTMRLVAEEANRGTLEMLLTSPIREWQIVLGKFFGALTAYLGLFAVTLVYPALLLRFGNPDPGPMLTTYLGLIGLSSAFISIGMFFSSVTDSQILAAVLSFVALLTLWIAHFLTAILPDSMRDLGEVLSLYSHTEKFNRGVIDATDVFYYVAFTAVFLVLSQRFIEARRWAS